ncbi:ATP-binding cassette domain-containing protein [Streptomyces sp. NPDC056308]|uniref:ATP-binding cassette domain-containing protein n=1 Tax=Streptomyces sp. NPDC056308 TaxID=3345780 RepID=UPI0035DFB1E1
MIKAYELAKRYGDTTVVHGLDFTVRPGTVTGFLGPNGAGKSTTMRMLLGLDAPTRGRSTIGGRAYAAHGAPLTEVGDGGRPRHPPVRTQPADRPLGTGLHGPDPGVGRVPDHRPRTDRSPRMTTAIGHPTTRPERHPEEDPYRVTATRVLRSEWPKLRSLRSSWITLVSASALVLGIGVITGATYTSGGGDSDVDRVVLVLYGSVLGTLCTVVLGILMTAGEYSTGLIRASLTAVPRRLPVLWAKAAVFTVTVFVVMFTTALLTFVIALCLWAGTTLCAAALLLRRRDA